MSTEFVLIIAFITFLILLPLIVMILVRILIKDDPEEEEEEVEAGPDGPDLSNLSDFWRSMVPHLIELRDRLVKSLVAVGIGTSIGFYLVNTPSIIGQPLPDFMVEQLAPTIRLQAIGVGEVFVSYFRIALVVGVAFAMPVIIYQIIAFFSPGLLPHEKRIVFMALPFVTELFLAGLAFGWFFTAPAALEFLLGYGQTDLISTVPTLDSFMGTVAMLLLWNGIIFQLPAVIFLLARVGIVTAAQLARTRRYAIVIITIIAALITPTGDPYNLLLLAIPMYLLYELGILLARLVPKRRETSETEAASAT
ncbi:MAG TPA: twin-arginine translocase subunit TatC [Roseiflexaceae bacterium]|nr:twin-arginine translocase subunit TatC [Roseiflexaceae bacterium]HMP40016.1 twin-arginine translocase subunit TatC [Roseiflexaceae bacterium]